MLKLTLLTSIFFLCIFALLVKSFKQVNERLFDISTIPIFIRKYGGSTLSHLLYLKDKQIFLAQDKTVLISYKKRANKYFVLGDPIGYESRFEAGLLEFLEYARKNRVTPVFYQMSNRFMAFFHDRGYHFFKIGEEAKVNVSQYQLSGKKTANIRSVRNKFLREGYLFEVVYPPYHAHLLKELEFVSNEWLGSRIEKSFSVSSFTTEYVELFPIATLRNPEGQLLAFASLPSDGKEKPTLSIDLMRYKKNSPTGTMDMLFVSIILWAKENHYVNCSLGMSPLANVGNQKGAFYFEKVARYIFLYSKRYYNFKGLQKYKSKFATDWEPKYMIYSRKSLLSLVIELVLIIKKPPQSKNESILKKVIRTRKVF